MIYQKLKKAEGHTNCNSSPSWKRKTVPDTLGPPSIIATFFFISKRNHRLNRKPLWPTEVAQRRISIFRRNVLGDFRSVTGRLENTAGVTEEGFFEVYFYSHVYM